VLDDCEVLIDSAAILDWLDQTVGPEHALMLAAGAEPRRALRLIALATGGIDKVGAAAYERLIRPAALRWPEWTLRCRTQGAGAIAALAAEPWSPGKTLDQAEKHHRLCSCCPATIPPSKRCPNAARRIPGDLAGRVRRSKEPVSSRSETSPHRVAEYERQSPKGWTLPAPRMLS
jgi:hypothetical protein